MGDNFMLRLAIGVPGILLALTIHEFAHALAADRLGDPTAKYQGRVSLNPIDHLDLFGTLLLFITLLSGSGFVIGWGKPVPINEYNFKNPRRDTMYVSLAGPMSNFLAAALFGAFVKYGFVSAGSVIGGIIYYFVMINIGLGVFNLIPIPPLDGSKILYGLLPAQTSYKLQEFEMRNRMFVMMAFFIILATGMLNFIIIPPFMLLMHFFIGG